MKFFDFKITISSNYQTEQEVMDKFEKWLEATQGIKTDLWLGNSCIIMLGVNEIGDPIGELQYKSKIEEAQEAYVENILAVPS